MSTKKRTELRLALGMRGGVSLAVWIGGACAEIDELRRAKSVGEGFWWEMLQASDYDRVVVDVLAGASAGGLNGVLFAAAIRNGFHMDSLLRVWKDVASVDKLRRRNEPWISLFDGDERFLDVIRDQLTDLIAKSPQEVDDPTCYVDLQLSATLIDPLDRAAISPGDEKLRRSRSTARFHFRHDPRAAPPRLDIELGDVGRLAVAARATASFPMAFEAAAVRATRPPQFQPRPPAASATPPPRPGDRAEAIAQLPADERAAALARLRLVDCRGVFSESRGAPKVDGTEFCDDDFVVADGGIVDNIPLGRALDAVRDAPADGPTRRVLVYLHPTGPSGIVARAKAEARSESTEERHVRRRGPLTMAVGLMASQVQGESIDGDLEQLEEHNRAVRLATVLRLAVLDELTTPPAAEGPGGASSQSPVGPVQLAISRLSGYLLQRAGADAVSIQRLLRDPLGVLGEDPFPKAPLSSAAEHRDDRWRSPLALWTREQRLQLDLKLRALFNERLGNRQMGNDILKGGLGPLSRVIGLLLELAREGEKVSSQAEALGQQKRRLYRLASLVRETDRFRQLGWVAEAGNFGDTDDLGAWLDAARGRLNLLLRCRMADAVILCDPDADDGAFALAYSNYFGNVAAALQATITGGRAPEPDGPVVDIRDTLVERLHLVTDEMLALLPPIEAPPPPPSLTAAEAVMARRRSAEVIQRVLVDGSATFVDRLAALEILLLSEHLVGAPGGVEIGFARMSAAAPVINAERFELLHKYSEKLNPEFTKDGDHLVPDVKLAGNELASFSAFLDERWRVNDWTWGRMDAVATLLDLLLGEDLPLDERPDLAKFGGVPGDTGWEVATLAPTDETLADRQALRRALIGRRQAEILSDATGDALSPDLSTWQAGLETLVRPGTPDLARQVSDVSSVAARVIGVALPRSVPRITGQLDGVARRLAMRLARPKGGLLALPGDPEPEPKPEGTPFKTLGFAALAGVGVAGLVWAISDHPVSLAIGLLVGLVVASVPGALLLWLAVQRPTDDDPRGAKRLVFVALALALAFWLFAAAVAAVFLRWLD